MKVNKTSFVRLRLKCVLILLVALGALPGQAASTGAGGLLVTWAHPEKPWVAGSEQRIRVEGSAVQDAVQVRYRWLGKNLKILAHGALARQAKGKFSGVVSVPRFADTASPQLHLEVERSSGQSWLYRPGQQFDAPELKGVAVNTDSPVIQGKFFSQGKWGRMIELSVHDTSGIDQAILLVGTAETGRVVQGHCRGKGVDFVCKYDLTAEQARLPAVAQLTNRAGNRTTASVHDGVKR